MKVVSAHQPNLFPNNAFWDKMKMSDIFELAIYDEFSTKMWVSKVMFGDEEKSERFKIPHIVRDYGKDRICDVLLKPEYHIQILDQIETVYRHFPKFKIYYPFIRDLVEGTQYRYLWEFNFAVIRGLKELLNIGTPITISEEPPHLDKTSDLVWMVKKYGGKEYLSGISGKHYIDMEMFAAEGIELSFFEKPADKFSILTRIFRGEI